MVSKSSEREGDKGSKFGLMDYTKQTRQQITYNNLETECVGKFLCAHQKWLLDFSAVPWFAVKLISKTMFCE